MSFQQQNRDAALEEISRQKAKLLRDNPNLVRDRRDAAIKRNIELEALEEELGVEGIRPSDKKKFKSTAVTGTTAHNAFTAPTIRES